MKNKAKKRYRRNKNYFQLKLLLLILGIAIILFPRVYPHRDKFGDKIIFKDPDTCYHARRIIYIATHNLRMPFYDPLISHPFGEIPIWSPLYDWINAVIPYLITLGNPSKNFILRASVILTLLFGILELFIIAVLVKKCTSSTTIAILSLIFVGISAPQIQFTSIEIIDHNSMLGFIFCLNLYIHYKLFAMHNNKKINIILIGLLNSLLFWIWSGSYIFIIALFLIQIIYIKINKRLDLLSWLSVAYFISALLIVPLAIVYVILKKQKLSFEYVSLFTVLFLIAISAGYLFLYHLLKVFKGEKRILSAMMSAIFLIFLIMISYYSFPNLLEGFRYTSAQSAWIGTIAESKPLFYLQRGIIKEFTLRKAIDKLGYFIFIFPIAFILILLKRIKLQPELYSIIIGSSILFGLIAFMQQKFAFEFTIPYGIILSIFIVWIYNKIARDFSIILILVFSLVIIISYAPMKKLFKEIYTPFYGYYSSFLWLKDETNLSSTEINDGHAQEIGVMAPWDLGHHLKFYSNVPVLADNFGTSSIHKEGLFNMVRFFLAEKEEEAIGILKKYKCKYVVVPFSSIYEQYPQLINLSPDIFHEYKIVEINGAKKIAAIPKDKFYRTIGFRLSDIYGSANPTDNEAAYTFQALKHFRLIHESESAISAGKEIPTGALKIYEYVDGIKLNVPEKGDKFYKVEALIITNANNKFYYRQYGYVKDGVIVPYPTYQYKDYPYAISYKVYVDNRVYKFKNLK